MKRRFQSAALLALAIGFLGGTAGAVTDAERAGARTQAISGAQAFEAGKWQESIDLFTRAESVVHSSVHLLYIAKAQIQLGQLVQAQENLLKIAGETVPAGAPAPIVQAQSEAQTLLPQLEPRIPQLTVTVTGAGSGLEVTMDGEPVPPGLVGVPRPVNPGQHTLHAQSEGRVGEATVTLAEGQKASIAVEISGTAASPAAGAASADVQSDMGAPSDKRQMMRIGSYVAFGVGAVGLGVGTVFALQHGSKVSDADDIYNACRGAGCSTTERDDINSLDDDANSAGTIATIGFVAGGVGIAAGVTLLVLSLQDDGGEAPPPAAGSLHVRPYAGLDRVGIVGSF